MKSILDLVDRLRHIFESRSERDFRLYKEIDHKNCEEYKAADKKTPPSDKELELRFTAQMAPVGGPFPAETIGYLLSLQPDLVNRKICMAYATEMDYDAIEISILRHAPNALRFFVSHGAEVKPHHIERFRTFSKHYHESNVEIASELRNALTKQGKNPDIVAVPATQTAPAQLKQ